MISKTTILIYLAVYVLCDKDPEVSQKTVKSVLDGQHNDQSHIKIQEPEARETYAHSYPSYEFSYKVDDPQTHDKKAQHEVRHGGDVAGNYWLMQRNGEKRYIKYHADDKSGFTATIKYSSPHSQVYYNSKKLPYEDGENAEVERSEGDQDNTQDIGQINDPRSESGNDDIFNKRNDDGRNDRRVIENEGGRGSWLSGINEQDAPLDKKSDGIQDDGRDLGQKDVHGDKILQLSGKYARRDKDRSFGHYNGHDVSQYGGRRGDARQSDERDGRKNKEEKYKEDNRDSVWWYLDHVLGQKDTYGGNKALPRDEGEYIAQGGGSKGDNKQYGEWDWRGEEKKSDGKDDSRSDVWRYEGHSLPTKEFGRRGNTASKDGGDGRDWNQGNGQKDDRIGDDRKIGEKDGSDKKESDDGRKFSQGNVWWQIDGRNGRRDDRKDEGSNVGRKEEFVKIGIHGLREGGIPDGNFESVRNDGSWGKMGKKEENRGKENDDGKYAYPREHNYGREFGWKKVGDKQERRGQSSIPVNFTPLPYWERY